MSANSFLGYMEMVGGHLCEGSVAWRLVRAMRLVDECLIPAPARLFFGRGPVYFFMTLTTSFEDLLGGVESRNIYEEFFCYLAEARNGISAMDEKLDSLDVFHPRSYLL